MNHNCYYKLGRVCCKTSYLHCIENTGFLEVTSVLFWILVHEYLHDETSRFNRLRTGGGGGAPQGGAGGGCPPNFRL